MTNNDIIDFWISAQNVVIELTLLKRPMTEAEAMMHASICRAIEEYFRLQQVLIDMERRGLLDKLNKMLKEEKDDTGGTADANV